MDKKPNYTLQDISEWAEKNTVSLPTVQRGFVWKPSQIENLWDSLLRGYPVGAFVLSPKENNGSFEMLDGQQRATAICLGFGKETFKDSQDKIKVFIDLERPKDEDNRKYIFRVITKSHPWGYQRTDNAKTLISDNIRKAMNLYQVDDHLEVNLDQFFPYDASLPVPFHLFIHAALKDENEEQLIKKIEKWQHWKKIKKQWEERVHKIQTEIQKNPQIRKTIPELSTNEKVSKRISEILDAVKIMIGSDMKQKIPALYLDFDKYKKTLVSTTSQETIHEDFNDTENNEEQTEEIDNSNDEIENLFIRLNAGGTPLRGEELNYSILKAKISSELQEKIEKSCEGLLKPSRFITIAYRLFQHQKKEENIDALTMRIKPKQFQRTITDKLSEFEFFLIDVLDNKSYNNKTLLEYSRHLLEYDENLNAYGLPYLITSKIADVAPEVMFILLYRLLHKKDMLQFNTDLHRKMIGMITLLVWLGKGEKQRDHAKLLSNVWPCVKTLRKELFWSSSTVQRALLNEVLIPFPSYDKPYDKNSLVQLRKYKAQSNSDIRAKFHRDTNYGRFIDKMFFNKDLILYAQREFLSKHFKEKQYHLDDTNVPFDWDHISPAKFIYHKFGIPKIIKYWYNTNGNYRAWTFSLNRMDQDDVPAVKLDPLNPNLYTDVENEVFVEIQNRWKQHFHKKGIQNQNAHELKTQLLGWSFCDKKWANCAVKDMKKDWKFVYTLILERNLSIFKKWYEQLKIDELIPNKKETFSTVINNKKWDINPKDDKELIKTFLIDDLNCLVSKPISICDTTVYIYITYNKNSEEVLLDSGIEFGIFEKSPGDFIRKIIIPDTEKMNYETDRKSLIQHNFTLISFDKDSYVELFKNFKLWLEGFPNDDVKKLADTLMSKVKKLYKVAD
ncbi:MAG: DUF262 domain-containing protein [Desulfobacterales bacterium]|nr:DUF262 domain-containing protein [Desulfobacterales bacterium]MDD4072417.1 DUF262 domain-containing protein [Desulfobacterales bacterium]MDD4393798.1 DUF262 domain-containing protein [Desulfobacterales bacterium]